LFCTAGDITVVGEPLYRTYWVGLNSSVCNTTSDFKLLADGELRNQSATNMVIERRAAMTYEACHWVVTVEENIYRDDTDAYVEIMIEKKERAIAYIYEGSSLKNVTAFIENN